MKRLTQKHIDNMVVDQRIPPADSPWWKSDAGRKLLALIARCEASRRDDKKAA